MKFFVRLVLNPYNFIVHDFILYVLTILNKTVRDNGFCTCYYNEIPFLMNKYKHINFNEVRRKTIRLIMM